MLVSVSWQLPEEVTVDPQGSWSYSAPCRRSCAPSRRCAEVSSGTWFQKPGSFFQSEQAWSMFHSHRGGWRWQEICRAWTCLWSWGCCTVLSWLVWPLLRQSWCRLLQSRCHSCTGLLSYCVLISSFVQNSKAKSKCKNVIVWNWSSQTVYSPLSRSELLKKKKLFWSFLSFLRSSSFYVSKIEDSFFSVSWISQSPDAHGACAYHPK